MEELLACAPFSYIEVTQQKSTKFFQYMDGVLKMKIQIVLFDGFGELVSFAPFEVLKRAIEEGAPFTVERISSEPKQ